MKKAMLEDRRLGFQNEVAGEFTLKGVKLGATKGDEPFVYGICKPVKSGRSVFVSAGDLQAVAIEAGVKDNKLPFPGLKLGNEVDVENMKVNENFTFAIENNRFLVKA